MLNLKLKKGYTASLLLTLTIIFISIVNAQTVNAQRIGIVSPKANLIDVSGTEAADAVQNTFYELMKSGTTEVVAIEARLPIQVASEAKQKGIQYILYSTLTQKRTKSGGGLFGKITNRVANTVSRNIPYGNNTGERIARDVAAETLITVSTLANTIKAKDELTLEYKLVSVGDSKTLVSNSIKEKAKENGEDIITGMIEKAANEVLTKVAGGSTSSVPTTTKTKTPKPASNKTTAPVFVPFAKLMNQTFAGDYVGKSVKTKVQFIAPNQSRGYIFGAIPKSVMEGKVAFRVSENEGIVDSETPFGSLPPHVFADKSNADIIFGLKKGDFLILTGSPIMGKKSIGGGGGDYIEIIFVATSIEKAK